MTKHAVSEQMTKSLVTIRDMSSMDEAYQVMYTNKIRHLPVRDKRGEITGILSDRDVMRAMESKISDAFGFKVESVKFQDGARVCDYMSWPVKTFDKETDLRAVLQMMINDKVSAYLITDEKEVVGIVTTDDFLQLLRKMLDKEDDSSFILADVLSNPLFGRVGQMASDIGI